MTDTVLPIVSVGDLRDTLEKWIAENEEVADFAFRHVEFGGLATTDDLDIEDDNEQIVFSGRGHVCDNGLTVREVLDRLDAWTPTDEDDDVPKTPENVDIDLFRVCHVEFGGLTRSCLIELKRGFIVLS